MSDDPHRLKGHHTRTYLNLPAIAALWPAVWTAMDELMKQDLSQPPMQELYKKLAKLQNELIMLEMDARDSWAQSDCGE